MFCTNSIPPLFEDVRKSSSLPACSLEKVLIVDDEPLIRDMLVRVVNSAGYSCSTAENGKKALELLARENYQLVLSDMSMPFLDGIQLLRHIISHFNDVAVIMITAVSDAQTAVESMSLGAYDYLIKPFDLAELRAKISRASERRRLLQENHQHQSNLEEKVREQTADLQQALTRLKSAYSHTLDTLITALDARERETQRHSKRVSDYTVLLARQWGVSSQELPDIERGALLHDIGKIGLSDSILLKPGKLSDQEWVEMRKHPGIGFNILKKVDFLADAAQLVFQHHEKFDGSGYPKGLRGEEILLGARIFAVVDTLDAMTSDRPYRKALTYQEAREEIICYSGRQFDPRIVEAFLSIPEETWFRIKRTPQP